MSFEIHTDGPHIEIRIFGTFPNDDLRRLAIEAGRIEASQRGCTSPATV